MTNQRWWAPQRGTTEPDQVVRHLLEQPGDLATTMLVVHRAGASACEAVAQGPVPSEAGLVQAMAAARAAFAPGVVDVVAKSMEASYAGLLVRDVLSEAESAALSLYRSAVAKGVSPPFAASRAGAVYGVPSREMGRYAVLATDPKANPVALVDAADRALLGYVAKLVAAEEDGQVVEFSKAPAAQGQAAQWDPNEHPRGQGGRFAETAATESSPEPPPRPGSYQWVRQMLGLGSESAPARVADIEPEQAVEQATPKARAQHATRQQRQARQRRQQHAQHAASTAEQRKREHRRSYSRSSVIGDTTQRLARAYARLAPKAKGKELTFEHTPPLLRTFGPSPEGQYGELTHGYTVIAGQGVMDSLLADMSQQADVQSTQFNDRRFFRFGHLQEASGTTLPEKAMDHLLLTGMISDAADEAHLSAQDRHGGGALPQVDVVSPSELREGATMSELARILEQRRKVMVTHTIKVGGVDRAVVDEEELQHVYVLPEYATLAQRHGGIPGEKAIPEEDLGYAVVHFMPGEPERPWDRPIPTVDEVVALTAYGRLEGPPGRHQQAVLDPNQAYQLDTPPGHSKGHMYESFWDEDRGVVVRRWYVSPIEESDVDRFMGGHRFGKALGGAAAMAFEEQHPRDRTGRFAETEETGRQTSVVPTSAPAPKQVEAETAQPQRRQVRQQRQQRQVRQQRQQRAVREPAAAAGTGQRRTYERSHETREQSAFKRVFERSRKARVRAGEDWMPALSDSEDYLVMSATSFEDWLDGNFSGSEGRDLLHGKADLELHSVARRGLREGDRLRAGQLVRAMATNVHQDMARPGGEAVAELASFAVHAVLDEEALATKVDQAFADHPSVDIIEIARYGHRYILYGNERPASQQHVIQYDPDIDWDAPVYLQKVGSYRARDLSMVDPNGNAEPLIDITGMTEERRMGAGAVPNPVLNIYRVTSSRLNLYRAGNT